MNYAGGHDETRKTEATLDFWKGEVHLEAMAIEGFSSWLQAA